MLPGRDGLVKVRASFSGEAEVLVRVGQKVAGGQTLAVVEGDKEIERLAVKTGGTVVEVAIQSGTDVEKGTLLVTIREFEEA